LQDVDPSEGHVHASHSQPGRDQRQKRQRGTRR
jgi:hypothetical protein